MKFEKCEKCGKNVVAEVESLSMVRRMKHERFPICLCPDSKTAANVRQTLLAMDIVENVMAKFTSKAPSSIG